MIEHQSLHSTRPVADGEHHDRHARDTIVAGKCGVRDGGQDVNLAIHRDDARGIGLELPCGALRDKAQRLEGRWHSVFPVKEVERIQQAVGIYLPRGIPVECYVTKVQVINAGLAAYRELDQRPQLLPLLDEISLLECERARVHVGVAPSPVAALLGCYDEEIAGVRLVGPNGCHISWAHCRYRRPG